MGSSLLKQDELPYFGQHAKSVSINVAQVLLTMFDVSNVRSDKQLKSARVTVNAQVVLAGQLGGFMLIY